MALVEYGLRVYISMKDNLNREFRMDMEEILVIKIYIIEVDLKKESGMVMVNL